MKKNIQHIFICLLFQCCISTAKAQDSLHYWGEPLTYTDFEGTPDSTTFEYALSHVGFHFTYSYDSVGKKLSFSVKAYFDPAKSWIKGMDSITLQHEQMHFDLAEVITRELYKELSAIEDGAIAYTQIDSLVNQYNWKLNTYHRAFDGETLYSADLEKHAAWRLKIDEMLKRF